MPAIALRAHYDGKQICLDEQFELPPNARLLVTVLPMDDGDDATWRPLAMQGIARSYGDDEPEYTLADIKR
jgi:hypothetical protein